MRKLTLLVLVLFVFSFASLDVSGTFKFKTVLNDTVNSGTSIKKGDIQSTKAEVYLKGDNFKAELDLPMAHTKGNDSLVVDQAYVKAPLAGGKLNVGIMETGIGALDTYSILSAAGHNGIEYEGMGIRYMTEIAGMKVDAGVLGTLMADKDESANDRNIFAVLTTEVAGMKVSAGGVYTTDTSADKSDIDAVAKVQMKMDKLVLNGNLRYGLSHDTTATKIAVMGASAKYGMGDLCVYGHYGMSLNDATKKNDVESDMLGGIAYKLDDSSSVCAEMQIAKTDGSETANQFILGFSTSVK